MKTKTIDARGLTCPLPVINAKKAAEEMGQEGVLTVLVDNEIAVQNLQKFASQKGYTASGEKEAEKGISCSDRCFRCRQRSGDLRDCCAG